MVHEKIKDLRDTLIKTKTENQSTHEIVKDIRDYLVGEKDELETTNEIVRDIRDELADTQVGITTAEMVKEIHDQIDDPAEAPQTIEEMLSDFQTSLSETETVSGNIVRFDNARALPFKKLNVNFQPIQDGTPWIQGAESEPYIQRAVSVERAGNHISDSIVGGTLSWNQLVKNEEEKEVSGDIATFDDGAENAPLSKLEVEFSPIQDLHGYDSPWPAGGGKNLVNVEGTHTITLQTILADYETTEEATFTVSAHIKNNTSIGVRLHAVIINGSAQVADNVNYIQEQGEGNFSKTFSTAGLTFTKIRIMVNGASSGYSCDVSNVQLEKGSTATDFAPYSNICPISGRDGGTVWGTGRNLFDVSYLTDAGYTLIEDEGATGYGYYYGLIHSLMDEDRGFHVFQKAMPFGRLTVSFDKLASSSLRVYFHYVGDDTWYNHSGNIQAEGHYSYTSNTSRTCDGLWFYTTAGVAAKLYIKNIKVEIGATETPFDGYSTHSYHSDFPSTVYGGTWGVTEGEIGETWAIVDLGSLTWTYHTPSGSVIYPYMQSQVPPDCKTQSITGLPASFITSAFRTVGSGYVGKQGYDNTIAQGGRALFVASSLYADEASFRSALNGVQMCYELDTPITLTVDPHTIPSQLGDNNVWSDAGETNITYLKGTDTLTLKSGRKYLTRINNTDSMVSGSDQSLTVSRGVDNVFDLTQMFGTAVGDHFYNQGASYFRKWFDKDYYEYCAGELKSVEGLAAHETVGFNQWDEEWEVGGINVFGELTNDATRIRSKNYIRLFSGESYYVHTALASTDLRMAFYDAEKAFVSNSSWLKSGSVTVPENVQYAKFVVANLTTYNHNICINISDPAKNGTYEPYVKYTYPLGNVTLRGIPKLNGNKWYYDGDTYKGSGSVTRKYGVVDLGTLNWIYYNTYSSFVATVQDMYSVDTSDYSRGLLCSELPVVNRWWTTQEKPDKSISHAAGSMIAVKDSDYTTAASFKAAMSGVMLLYELAEPTTESAAKYTSVQIPGTVERYVTDSIVPVGHETRQMDIFPISGRDSVEIQQRGINLFDGQTENGEINEYTGQNAGASASRVRSVNYIPVSYDMQTLYFYTPGREGNFRLFYYDKDKNYLSYNSVPFNSVYTLPASLGDKIKYIRFRFARETIAEDAYISINYPSTDHDYHSYQGTTHIINLGGNYYGGTLRAETGEIAETWAIVDLSSLNYSKTTSGLFQTDDLKTVIKWAQSSRLPSGYIISSMYNAIDSDYITGPQGANPSPDGVMAENIQGRLYFNYVACTTVEDFKAAMQGVQLCYELAEPTTISIAPQKISAYLGSNTIWSDGDQVEVEYRSKQNRENQENS